VTEAVSRGPAGLIDLGGVHRLAERAVRGARVPAAEDRQAHPGLGPHRVLADQDWHRERVWTAGGVEHAQTDHWFSRWALLPDARLVRADRWRSELRTDGLDEPAAPWRTAVRALTVRDVLVLDRPTTDAVEQHGRVRTWGVRAVGEPTAPWPGAGLERLLKALADRPVTG